MMKATMRKRESVIVVLEGVKASSRDHEKGVAPLSWAMRHVVHVDGDLLVLNILNPTISNAGFCYLGNQRSLTRDKEGYLKFLHEQIRQRRGTFLKNLQPYYDLCKTSRVKFEAKVAAGFHTKALVKEEANNVGATCIVLDRSLVEALSLQTHWKSCTIVLVDDHGEAEVQNPPAIKGLDIPIVRIENPNPKSPMLLKESLQKEEAHIRDSLPVTTGKDEESGVHTPTMINIVDIPMLTNETPNPNSPKLLKESLSCEEPHIRDSLPRLQPFLESIGCEKDIFTDPFLERTNEHVTMPKTGELDNAAWRRNLEPTLVLRLPIELSWNEILAITDRFSMPGREHLEMYRGRLRDLEVIVKQFYSDCNSIFEAEKRVSSSMAHRNFLVPIYYHESSYAFALVYPYTGNGTLNQYLSGNLERLTCQERMKIATGIGQGLRYMHEEFPGGPIVHGDLCPCNIFLGHNYQPFISGFGQARWPKMEKVTMAESNNGCCHEAPSDHDWVVLVKSDVFAFGVLLLRLFCQQAMLEDDMEFVDWAQPLLLKGAFHEMLDPDMEDLDMYEMYRVMSAATQCTKPKRLSRPSMTQVLSILSGESSCVMQPSPSSESSLMTHQFL